MTRHGAGWLEAAAVATDVLRVGALVSAAVAVPLFPFEAAVRFTLIFGLLIVTRIIVVPRPFDAVFAAGLLATGWASPLGWYYEHAWVDVPIHFALTGSTAAMLYFGLARLDLLPKPEESSMRREDAGIVLVVTLLGATAALVWELYEWFAENYLPSRILVGYDDTILDMTMGLLGSVTVGACTAWWQRTGHGLRSRS